MVLFPVLFRAAAPDDERPQAAHVVPASSVSGERLADVPSMLYRLLESRETRDFDCPPWIPSTTVLRR